MATIKDVTVRIKTLFNGKESEQGFDDLEKGTKKTKSSFESLNKSILKVGGALAGAFALKAVIGDAVTRIKAFDQSMADLGAITGTSGKRLESFKKEVLAVSKATGKGASDIAKAFQIVGSAQPELLKSSAALAEVTKQAVILSKAGGIDVPSAADALTKSMNQFGASAADAAMFTDILATSQQLGTSTIDQTAEALKNAGAVANAAGLSFEETNIAIQALAKGGLLGAEAGTGLRGTLSKLASQSDTTINPTMNTLAETIENLSNKNLDLESATKLVGIENAKSLLTLVAQKDVVTDLTGALNDQGNALEQADQRFDTITGRSEEFLASYERVLLGFEDGQGTIGNVIQSLQEFGTQVLKNIEIDEQASKIGLTRGLFQDFDVNAKAVLLFSERLNEQAKQLALTNASADQYRSVLRAIKSQMDETDRSTETGNATYVLLREQLITLGAELRNIENDTANVTSATNEDTEATNRNTEAKKTSNKESEKAAKLKAMQEKEAADLKIQEAERAADIQSQLDDIEISRIQDDSDRQKAILMKRFEDEIALLDDSKSKENALIIAKKQELQDELNEIDLVQEELQDENRQKIVDQEVIDQEMRLQQKVEIGQASVELFDALSGLAKKGSKEQKVLAIAAATNRGALAVLQILSGNITGNPVVDAIIKGVLIATTTAQTATQINRIQSTKTLKDGEVDIDGPGTTTSDSIPAMLSRGESVINARSTKKHKAMLKAINDDRLDEHLNRVLIKQMYMGGSKDKVVKIESKNEPMNIKNFPSSFNIGNPNAISKPLLDAIEESNFLNQNGSWE